MHTFALSWTSHRPICTPFPQTDGYCHMFLFVLCPCGAPMAFSLFVYVCCNPSISNSQLHSPDNRFDHLLDLYSSRTYPFVFHFMFSLNALTPNQTLCIPRQVIPECCCRRRQCTVYIPANTYIYISHICSFPTGQLRPSLPK